MKKDHGRTKNLIIILILINPEIRRKRIKRIITIRKNKSKFKRILKSKKSSIRMEMRQRVYGGRKME